jgi:hypothetical protein
MQNTTTSAATCQQQMPEYRSRIADPKNPHIVGFSMAFRLHTPGKPSG